MIDYSAKGTLLTIKVLANSKSDRLQSANKQWVKIALQAPAHDFQANERLVLFLAELLGIKPQLITLIKGFYQPIKQVIIDPKVPMHEIREKITRLAFPPHEHNI